MFLYSFPLVQFSHRERGDNRMRKALNLELRTEFIFCSVSRMNNGKLVFQLVYSFVFSLNLILRRVLSRPLRRYQARSGWYGHRLDHSWWFGTHCCSPGWLLITGYIASASQGHGLLVWIFALHLSRWHFDKLWQVSFWSSVSDMRNNAYSVPLKGWYWHENNMCILYQTTYCTMGI